jgi:hypothetical protein
MHSKRLGAIGALAPILSGCFAATLWDAEKIPQDDQVVDNRVSSRPADLDGRTCYVDRQDRVTSQISVPDRSALLLGAVLEGIFGLAEVGVSQNGSRDQYLAGAVTADAMLTFGYIIFRDDKATVSTRWEQTNEPATCAH